MRSVIRSIVNGTLTGLLILGLGGRVAMVATSWLLDLPVGLTLRGTMAVIVTGGIYGALGGAMLHFVGPRLPRSRLIRVAIVGTVLFVIVAVASTLNRQTGPAWQHPVLTVALFLPLAWVWAYSILLLSDRQSTRVV